MKNRLDEVFSVEKLRRAWKAEAAPEQDQAAGDSDAAGSAPNGGASAARAAYQRLRDAIEISPLPGCALASAPLLLELEELLQQRFPAEAPAGTLQVDRAQATLAIDGLLNRLEDLLEAFEVGSGR